MNEAELLFTEILKCERLSLYLDKEKILDRNDSSRIAGILKQRIQGRPLEYILGRTEFMGLELKVNSDVLIPRPETELLVEKILERVARSLGSQAASVNILDIGTGSGNIAIALAKMSDSVFIDATDISQGALKVSRENAILHRVKNKIKFFISDLFNNEELKVNGYDYILSNPPYVQTKALANLDREVKCQPKIALDGGRTGLGFYRKIISGAGVFLKERGLLVLEMGFGQSRDIIRLIELNGGYEVEEIVKDYSGIDRVLMARRIIKTNNRVK
jgi:release factor glutamine methyltransferase